MIYIVNFHPWLGTATMSLSWRKREFHVTLEHISNAAFEIYASTGNLIDRIIFEGSTKIEHNLDKYPTGVYIIKLVTNDSSYTYRLTKK